MFENLSEKLQYILKNLRGEGKLSVEHIEQSLKEIRISLLEADVNFKVVKDLTENIRSKALGQKVLNSLSPAGQVVKIVRDELIEIVGPKTSRLNFAPQLPTVVMLVGLQGSGKTTSSGKLAIYLQKLGRRPMLVSADIYRPAAMEQLRVVGANLGINVYKGKPDETPVEICQNALKEAKDSGYDTLIIDTAGRLHIDKALMEELVQIKEQIKPQEILFVADAMLGQDAVKSAKQFHEQISFDGLILTKLDGDARGGAALSIKSVTGKPVKFVGTGEKYDALDVFHPDRMISRILGMGDVLSLIEKAEGALDHEKALELQKKVFSDSFTLEDFREQLRQIQKIGSLDQIMEMLPNIGPFKGLNKLQIDDKEIRHTEAIIDSMTRKERRNHKLINGSRRKRIARGSGTSVERVNKLLKQYIQTRKMMKNLTGASKKKGHKRSLMKGLKLPQIPM